MSLKVPSLASGFSALLAELRPWSFSRDWRASTFHFYYAHLRFNLVSFSFPVRQDALLEYAKTYLPQFKIHLFASFTFGLF